MVDFAKGNIIEFVCVMNFECKWYIILELRCPLC
jgi:hypothetical protein